MTQSTIKPLEDIRVLSVTIFLAGPFLSMTLAITSWKVIWLFPDQL